jgi:dTDP-4-dehydrorhamnose reductase
MSKMLVLGKGYLGKEFERHGIEVWGRDKFNVDFVTGKFNNKTLDDLNEYDTVINCIGKSNTRWCEDPENFDEMIFVNGHLPKILSNHCKENNIKFVHISTGCLYDDTTKVNTESDFISAHCNYTVSKWVGEKGCNKMDLILRPRLYFSDTKDRNNLLCKLPRFKSFTGDKLDSLTCTSTIVGATKELVLANESGIFNVAQIGSATISNIAAWCGIPISLVNTAEELRKREGIYLVNSVMDISKLLKYYKPLDIKTSIQLSYNELVK